MAGHVGLEGLHRVRMQEVAPGAPIVVASFDDRFNIVGGLTYKQRMRMLPGIEATLTNHEQGAGRRADAERFALWTVLHINHQLMGAKGLTWTDVDGEPGGGRLRQGASVMGLLPREARRSDLPGPRIGRLVAGIRARLEKEVFGDGVFASNHDLQAASLHALIPDWPGGLVASRRLLPLPDGRGTFSTKTVAQVLRYYGLGRPAKARGQRGYRVARWRLRQVMDLAGSMSASLDLRTLPWRHGAYVVAAVQS